MTEPDFATEGTFEAKDQSGRKMKATDSKITKSKKKKVLTNVDRHGIPKAPYREVWFYSVSLPCA